MADVGTTRDLLILALQDLSDAESAMIERLPQVRRHAKDPAFAEVISGDERLSVEQRDSLKTILRALDAPPDGPRNIWLRAILDDADNDAATIAAGVLLDIALVGALRKGKQSERVSYETAIRLAARLDLPDAVARLTAIRDEEAATDTALAEILARLAGEA